MLALFLLWQCPDASSQVSRALPPRLRARGASWLDRPARRLGFIGRPELPASPRDATASGSSAQPEGRRAGAADDAEDDAARARRQAIRRPARGPSEDSLGLGIPRRSGPRRPSGSISTCSGRRASCCGTEAPGRSAGAATWRRPALVVGGVILLAGRARRGLGGVLRCSGAACRRSAGLGGPGGGLTRDLGRLGRARGRRRHRRAPGSEVVSPSVDRCRGSRRRARRGRPRVDLRAGRHAAALGRPRVSGAGAWSGRFAWTGRWSRLGGRDASRAARTRPPAPPRPSGRRLRPTASASGPASTGSSRPGTGHVSVLPCRRGRGPGQTGQVSPGRRR